MFTKKILAAAITSQPSANGVADAIDFDGANDYLSRSSDLVGNTDGKTFTFSAWVWVSSYMSSSRFVYSEGNGSTTTRFYVQVGADNKIYLLGMNTSNINVLDLTVESNKVIARDSFLHILVSVDLSNAASRRVYLNDIEVTGSCVWSTYTNGEIDFTNTFHAIGTDYAGATNKYQGRLAHIYLDKTCRDLSVEANRRLFITADRKPTPKATLQALNPILYLPLDDPTQAGKNLGTGGDFTLNGVVARSGRGPNQFNAAYSDLDGSADYLSRSSITGIADGKQVTIACSFVADSITGNDYIFDTGAAGNSTFFLRRASGILQLVCYTTGAASTVVSVNITSSLVIGRNYHLVVSFDAADTNKRHTYLNGQTPSDISWNTYNNATIDLTQSIYRVGAFHNDTASNWDGRIGNLFFDTRYIDLSVPANLAKFVTGTGIDAKPVDLGANGEKPFGTPPLIYLPMYGNNAGKNYGTGGDFTVNSGPFAGARGPNEYWGNKADFDGSTGYLYRTSALNGVGDGKTFSMSFNVSLDTLLESVLVASFGKGQNNPGQILINSSGYIYVLFHDSSNSTVCYGVVSTTKITTGSTFHVSACVDLSNSSKRFIHINGILQSVTWNNYSNTNINWSGYDKPHIGVNYSSSGARVAFLDGKLSEFYFTTDYIDFSQEANRLKFRDAFGNPVDLRPQIAAGTLPNPAIYMRFDPSNFGKNDGTGGDFVVNGTITDGGQL